MTTVQPQTQRICLASRTVLEFTFSGDLTVLIPAPTRGQMNRCAELESAEASPAPENLESTVEAPADTETRFAKGFRRFAKGMREASRDDDAAKAVETLRRAQLAILAEGAEPPLNVAKLSGAECAQMLWAITAHHFHRDPALAAEVCAALVVAHNEEAHG